MADATVAPAQERWTQRDRSAGASLRFDWAIAILSIWLVAGFYLDLWAHAHGMVDDTFLTPWHAILYAGAAVFGLTLGVPAVRNLVHGAPWRHALPGPYLASLVGLIGFLVAGQVDFVWHSIFGFEVDVAALLSPPHLVLAVTGVVALSGPIRSVWSRPVSVATWRTHGPAVIGLVAILSVFAALTQYAHPLVDPLAQAPAANEASARPPLSQLYAMAADGSGQHRIAVTDTDERNPRLSPDGRVLAFSASSAGSAQILLSDADGANRRPITTEGSNARPAWSPDGSRIAFHSDRGGSLDIYTMAADGMDVRAVTTDPTSEYGPTWSPDGTRIAFTTDRDGTSQVYIAALDGAGAVRLSQDGGSDPAWSPDGSRIAYASPDADGHNDIVSVAVDGSDPRRLTDADGDSDLPAWSPDGASIAFTTNRDGDLEVYAMAADGSDQRNLTRSPGVEDGWYGPSWSPDGRSILYPSQGTIPDGGVATARESLGAASILIQAALLAGFALLALRRGPLPIGALTMLVLVPTALIALLDDQYRFLPGALVAGVLADLLVRRLGSGASRRGDALIAFAIPAAFFGSYFVTLQVTGGIDWTVHLWLGAIVLAGIIGLVLDEAMRSGRRPAATP